jgi:hypothetical protein
MWVYRILPIDVKSSIDVLSLLALRTSHPRLPDSAHMCPKTAHEGVCTILVHGPERRCFSWAENFSEKILGRFSGRDSGYPEFI